jgi:hypothetical protein
MAKIWKEIYGGKYDKAGRFPSRPQNYMPKIGEAPPFYIPAEVWFVKVSGFTFIFHNLDQLVACLDYYSSKTHPSSIISKDNLAADLGPNWREERGWGLPRWFERLPMFLLEPSKRKRVVAALTQAREQWTSAQNSANPSNSPTPR